MGIEEAADMEQHDQAFTEGAVAAESSAGPGDQPVDNAVMAAEVSVEAEAQPAIAMELAPSTASTRPVSAHIPTTSAVDAMAPASPRPFSAPGNTPDAYVPGTWIQAKVEVAAAKALSLAKVKQEAAALKSLDEARIDCTLNMDRFDKQGKTVIHVAARNGHLQVLRFLKGLGAQLGKPNGTGWTPAHDACSDGHVHVLRFLLDAGIDLGHAAHGGWTPAHETCSKGHVDALRFLKEEAKVDVHKVANGSWTLAHEAASKGHVQILEFLEQLNVNFGAVNHRGRTPASAAAHGGRVEALMFLKSRASLSTTTSCGWTPAHEAAGQGHVEALSYLHEVGVDIGAANDRGRTPAHDAAANGHVDVLRFLHSVGADLAKRTTSGWTPAHEATSHGHFKVVSFLTETLGKVACLGVAANDDKKESVPFPADALSWSMPPPSGGRLVCG